MKIGDQLQKQRKLHHMSQNELAEKLHLTRQSISKWENGTTLPSFANVIAISELFDISLDELIKGDVALMNKFNSDETKFSKGNMIFMISFLAIIVVLLIIWFMNISTSEVDNWFSGLGFIFFIGLLFNIKWNEFNKSLNMKAVIFAILMIITIIVPHIMHEVPEVIKDMDIQQQQQENMYK